MGYSFRLSCFVLILLARGSVCNSQSVPDSVKGLNKQFTPVFNAYLKGDWKAMHQRLDTFAVPQQWFTDVFGAVEGPELAKVYVSQFAHFELRTRRVFDLVFSKIPVPIHSGLNNLFVLNAKPASNMDVKPAPKPPPPALRPLPRMQGFEFEMGMWLNGEYHFMSSWMDAFVYLDGAFRFFGFGAYPFWDLPNVRDADPCAKPGEQPGGKVITRVEPVYPEEAKQKHVQGTVLARLTIAADGSVEEFGLVRGDPLLVDAARQAMMQWRFTPFMNCGRAVEMRSYESVDFTLP